MRLILILLVLCILACTEQKEIKQPTKPAKSIENLVSVLDTIWRTEQTPIRMRDSLMKIYGVESPEAQKQQEIFEKNHLINEKKVVEILGKHEWPDPEITGESGNLTICNVIQHSDIETRIKYLPIMKEAVKRKKLEPRLLARSEDRLATDRGELQVYGGQIKYYPETKSFDVWPIVDPANVDQRRAGIGLEPIIEFLKSKRTPLEWNLADQQKRTEEFIKNKKNETNNN